VELADFSLPASVTEIIKRGSGLNVICGPQRSGRSTLANLLCEKINEENEQAIAVITEDSTNYSDINCALFGNEMLTKGLQFFRGFDLIVIDSQASCSWQKAAELAEVGYRVILTLPFPGVKVAIERFSERLDSNLEIGQKRLSSILQLVVGLRLIPAVENGYHSAYELLLITNEVREALLTDDWDKIENLMSTQGEKTGMRTLNQCLMNLMLKRKIDLKVGFSESPRPEELDQMLEKVGF